MGYYSLLAIFLSTLAFTSVSFAQEVSIGRVERQGGDVIIYYELLDDNEDRKYAIHLYSSRDNFVQPLEKVGGDIGVNIAVGGNKAITWNASEELGSDFTGDVALEIKGAIYIPFISIDNFEEYGVLKRGKSYDFIWTGGRGDNVLVFELYKEGNRVYVFEERPNVGNTTLAIPGNIKPGKDYQLKISDTRNRDEVVFTGTFAVKRKVPLVLEVGAVAAIAGSVGLLVSGQEDPGEEDIVPPPKAGR